MTKFPIRKITVLCEDFAPIDKLKEEQLNKYGNLLLEWNEKINLTAITNPEEVVYKHFLDCLLFFKNIQPQNGASIIDVGTGAGFPGIILKIARPDIKLTLLDSLNKRLVFLNEVIKELELKDITTVHSRAEDGARIPNLREKFDIATARAVAPLNILSEYCLPYVKPGGYFISLKGPTGEEEIAAASNAVKLLGGEKSEVYREEINNIGVRTFIKIKKISQTSSKYPRNSGKIAKHPL